MQVSKPSASQLEMLLSFMEQNPEFAHVRLIGPNGRKTLDSMWSDLTLSLNSSGGTHKSVVQWKKTWKDKFASIKLKAAEIKNAQNQSGINGLPKVKELNEVEIRILSVMSSDYVDGDGETQEGGFNQQTVGFNVSTEVIAISNDNSGPSRNPANGISAPSQDPAIQDLQGSVDISTETPAGSSRRLTTQGQGQKRKRITVSVQNPSEDPFTISNDIEKHFINFGYLVY